MWMANFVFLAIGLVLLRATTKETGGRRWKLARLVPGRRDDEPTPLEAGLEGRGQRVGVRG
jgi:hypothetical protein